VKEQVKCKGKGKGKGKGTGKGTGKVHSIAVHEGPEGA
jgi:hypothetical protein